MSVFLGGALVVYCMPWGVVFLCLSFPNLIIFIYIYIKKIKHETNMKPINILYYKIRYMENKIRW